MAPRPDPPATTYPGGFARLMRRFERPRPPYPDPDGVMPPEALDLAAAAGRRVAPPDRPFSGRPQSLSDKRRELDGLLAGRPELLLHHALVVATLRRDDPPAHAAALFRRMWEEEGALLARELPTRWLVSAATTFADHGATAAQRAAGLSLSTLFGMMKLYETERLHSGAGPREAHPWRGTRAGEVPLDLGRYSVASGDLDLNLLARAWREGERDAATRHLSAALLNRLNGDPGTVFRRLMAMRAAGRALDGGAPVPMSGAPPDPETPR